MPSDNPVSIPLGIFIGLLASCVQSLGLTIQRKSHVQNQALPEHLQRVEHKRPLWLLGFAVFISSNILGSLVQIASLPVVILAPLGAVSLLWNAFFARLLLGDLLSPWMVFGTIFIAGGAVLIAVFGIVPEQTRSLEDLLALFGRPTFIVYFSLLGFFTVVCLAITHLTEFSLARRIAKHCPSSSASSSINLSPSAIAINLPTHTSNVTTGITEEINDATLATATERTPLIDKKSGTVTPTTYTHSNHGAKTNRDPVLASINRTRVSLAISYASFSGILSGMCLLFAKSGVELLLLTLKGHNQFWRWESWCLLLGLVVFALLQLWYLHKALVYAAPTLVCPSAFCFYNLSSIVNGLIYFDQFALIPPLHLGLVGLGIVVLLGGVWTVSVQSGPVDVGPWDDEFTDLSDEESVACSEPEQSASAETVPLLQQSVKSQQSSTKRRVGPVPMDRETRSDSNMPNINSTRVGLGIGDDVSTENGFTTPLSSSPETEGRLKRRESALYETPRKPSSSSCSPRGATDESLRIQTTPSRLSGAVAADSDGSAIPRATSYSHQGGEHRNTFLQRSQTMLSPSRPGSTPTFGTGFQIGLSPVSPGFGIFPSDRRRGTVYGTPSLMEVVHGAGATGMNGKSRRDMKRRRTVSEGEITARSRVVGDDQEGDERSSGQQTSVQANGDEESEMRAKVRWKWLRKVMNITSDRN